MSENRIHQLHPVVVCAWCEAESGNKQDYPPHIKVSHGICEQHQVAVLKEIREKRKAM